MAPFRQRECAEGIFDLGVAHGSPGVIGFLARAAAAGFEPANDRTLQRSALGWLLRQAAPTGPSAFGVAALPGQMTRGGARAAWCYGDPGIVGAILPAAYQSGEPKLIEQVLQVGHRAASRRAHDALTEDAGLCHGTAGLAHVFARIHQATADRMYVESARYWFSETLRLRQEVSGISGFLFVRRSDSDAETQTLPLPGFLEGATGVGLALLAAVSAVSPDWDRLLILSPLAAIPQRRGSLTTKDVQTNES